jgi:Secretion system C-terminal sorting domain/Putative serine esterase (DUF676)
MRHKVWCAKQLNKLMIGAVSYNFGYIDSNAYNDGRLSIDSTTSFIKDNNTAELPYKEKQINFATLLSSEVDSNDDYLLSFLQENCLTNFDLSGMGIAIKNLTTNQDYNLLLGTEKPISFKQLGLNILEITVKLNGNNYTYYQKINVVNRNSKKTRALGSDCWPKNEMITSTIQFQGYDEAIATNTYADYHIYYHTKSATDMDCERVLRKPIIFIDGFDAQNKRPYSDIYKYELLNIQNPSQNLGEELRKLGYDLVILNFPMLGQKINKSELLDDDVQIPLTVNNGVVTPINGRDGGTDYIERNAFALVKLIQDLNSQLPTGSTEKLSIIGPSMGGQIARYALAYMENQEALGTPNMNHNTRLFISFDSPHDGANIPVSVAQCLDHFGNFYGQTEALTTYNQKIRCTVARQLLIEQIDGLNGLALFHSTYYNALKTNGINGNNGWPVKCRKVGIADGSGNGTLNGIADNQVLSLLAYAALGKQAIHFNLRTMPAYNISNMSYNGFGKKTINAALWGVPPPVQTTYSYPCANMTKINSYSQSSFLIVKKIDTWSSEYTTKNMNTRGVMDIVPGGIFNAFEEVYLQFDDILKATSSIKQINWQMPYVKYHTFIPTVSALAFKNPNFNWANKVNDRNLVCTNETYFDNYIFSSQNVKHVGITNEIFDFALEEIQKGRKGTDCYNMCPATVTGDDCIKQNITLPYTYGFTLPLASKATITCSPNLQVQTKSTTGYTMKGLTPGVGWVKIVFDNPCGQNLIINKVINVDLPSIPAPSITITQSTNTCSKWWVQYNFGNASFGTYTWGAFKTGVGSNQSFFGTGSGSCGFYVLHNQQFGWMASVINDCGDKEDGHLYKMNVITNNCGTGTYNLIDLGVYTPPRLSNPELQPIVLENYSVLPNPTYNNWTIGILTEQVKELKYKLLNMQGQIIEQNSFSNLNMNDFKVGNSSLPKGLYFLKIKTDFGEETLKLLKE